MKTLILFSGGKDSLLCATRYLDSNNEVYLVTYSNQYEVGSKNALMTAKRLKKKYGDKVNILGIKNINPIFREFINPIYNDDIKDILTKYGNISISQLNCLCCRSAMYVLSIIISKELKIDEVVDGARSCQLFAIEQEIFLSIFKELFKSYNLNIEFPLKDLNCDWDLKNELLMRGILPKTIEPQCLLGIPEKEVPKEILEGLVNIYNNYLKEKIISSIEKYKNINITGELY